MLRNSEQLVGPGDGVQVGAEAVEEVGVRFPDLLQHLDVETELVSLELVRVVLAQAGEAEPLVPPVLTEVAVHGVVL